MAGRKQVGYLVKQVPNTARWEIKPDGAGRIPAALRGSFTSEALALEAIERHKNGKNSSK